MKELFVTLFLVISSTLCSLHGAPHLQSFLKIDPQLNHYVRAIQSFDEGKKLLSNVLNKGPLQIRVANNSVVKEFSACWSQEERAILIYLSSSTTEGEIIGSLLFELHNALVSDQIDRLDYLATSRKINKQDYVRSIEHLEYVNSINASRIANIGIQRGILPKTAALPTYPNFEEHFYCQKISGHSNIIGMNYDMLTNHR